MLLEKGLFVGGMVPPQLKPSHFSQPIPHSLRVSQICATWHLPATHSYLISSQIERREIWADWRDKFWWWKDREQSESQVKKMWTQSAMCWLCWLGACAKKSLSIPSFLLFTLCLTSPSQQRHRCNQSALLTRLFFSATSPASLGGQFVRQTSAIKNMVT